MISDLERNATMIRKSIDCIDDRGRTIGTTISRQDSWMTGCRLASAIRPTYYDSPADDVNLAQLPRALFGSLSAVASPISCGGSRSPSPGGADDYGWMPKDGKFYNIYTKFIADRHPFSDISNTT